MRKKDSGSTIFLAWATKWLSVPFPEKKKKEYMERIGFGEILEISLRYIEFQVLGGTATKRYVVDS